MQLPKLAQPSTQFRCHLVLSLPRTGAGRRLVSALSTRFLSPLKETSASCSASSLMSIACSISVRSRSSSGLAYPNTYTDSLMAPCMNVASERQLGPAYWMAIGSTCIAHCTTFWLSLSRSDANWSAFECCMTASETISSLSLSLSVAYLSKLPFLCTTECVIRLSFRINSLLF